MDMLERRGISRKEREIISSQMRLYGTGERQGAMAQFDYRRSVLDPAYALQILDPFVKKIKRSDQIPRVLDLGAGKGEAGVYMGSKGANVVKADISRDGLRGECDATQVVAWKLPFANKTFDGIHSKDMLTHIPTEFRPRLFYELNRVTKPMGRITICSVNQEKGDHFQYPVIKDDLISYAGLYGFSIENGFEWNSNPMYKDWYKSIIPRFVLELKKIV